VSIERGTTRERILKAAWALLDSNPGVAARMSDIAREAGVSRQALYLHFPSRTELFIAATRHQDAVYGLHAMLDAGICSGAITNLKTRGLVAAPLIHQDEVFGVQRMLDESRAAETGLARLDAFIAAWCAYIPRIFGVAKTLMVMKETDADAAGAWAARMADMREGCAAAVLALERDGMLADGFTVAEATDMLWSLLSVDIWESLTRNRGWDQARYVAAMRLMARRGLTRAAP